MSFVANGGQTDERVKFTSRGPGYSIFLTETEAVLALSTAQSKTSARSKTDIKFTPPAIDAPNAEAQHVLRMKLMNANGHPSIKGLDELPGKASSKNK